MKTLMSCLLGLAVVAVMAAAPQKAEAGDCFNQFQVQRVVVPQHVQQVRVQRVVAHQPQFVQQRVVVRNRAPLFQRRAVVRQRTFIRQPVGFNATFGRFGGRSFSAFSLGF